MQRNNHFIALTPPCDFRADSAPSFRLLRKWTRRIPDAVIPRFIELQKARPPSEHASYVSIRAAPRCNFGAQRVYGRIFALVLLPSNVNFTRRFRAFSASPFPLCCHFRSFARISADFRPRYCENSFRLRPSARARRRGRYQKIFSLNILMTPLR